MDKWYSLIDEGILTEEEMFLLLEDYPDDLYDKMFSDIPRLSWDNLVGIDPSTIYTPEGKIKKVGKYVKWMSKVFRENPERFMEDLYKVEEYLKVFHKYKDKLDSNFRDIQKFKGIGDLYEAIKDVLEKHRSGSRDILSKEGLRKDILKRDVKVVDSLDNWVVYTPETYEASCELGSGTEWCTAAGNTRKWFDKYTADGPLYVFVYIKNPRERYQMHVESGQFMDITDRSVRPPDEIFEWAMELASSQLEKSQVFKGDKIQYKGDYIEVIIPGKEGDVLNSMSGVDSQVLNNIKDFLETSGEMFLAELLDKLPGEYLKVITGLLNYGGYSQPADSEEGMIKAILGDDRVVRYLWEILKDYAEWFVDGVNRSDSDGGDAYGYLDSEFMVTSGSIYVSDDWDSFYYIIFADSSGESFADKAICDAYNRINAFIPDGDGGLPYQVGAWIVTAIRKQKNRNQLALPLFGGSRGEDEDADEYSFLRRDRG